MEGPSPVDMRAKQIYSPVWKTNIKIPEAYSAYVYHKSNVSLVAARTNLAKRLAQEVIGGHRGSGLGDAGWPVGLREKLWGLQQKRVNE